MPAFYQYADDAPKLGPVVHVTIEYQTTGGSPGAWSRWVHHWDHCEDELTRAMEFATEHVRGFKRVGRIYGGTASPLVRQTAAPKPKPAPLRDAMDLEPGLDQESLLARVADWLAERPADAEALAAYLAGRRLGAVEAAA